MWWAFEPERGGAEHRGTLGSTQHPPARVYAVGIDSQAENREFGGVQSKSSGLSRIVLHLLHLISGAE